VLRACCRYLLQTGLPFSQAYIARSLHDHAHVARELWRLFERIEMSSDTYEFRAFTRLKQMKYLQRTRQVDDDLYWRAR